jgi:autotransporter-associated beta strand protein
VSATAPLGTPDNPLNLYGGGFSASGLGTLSLPNAVNLADVRVNLGGVTNMVFTGPVTLTGSSVVNVGPEVATFAGPVSGSGGLTKLGGIGNFILTGPNSYSGGTVLLDGQLTASDPDAFGTGVLNLRGGTLQTNQAGGLTLNSPVALTAANATVGGSNPIVFGGEFTLTGVNNLTANVDVAITGPVDGTGALSKGGPGTLALYGINTQTGATAVTAGTLLIDGSQPGSPVAVRGGVLGGAGFAGLVAASSPAVLAPGDPASAGGYLAAAGADFSNGGTLTIHIGGYTTPGGDYGQLDVSAGTLTLGGSSVLTLDLSGLTEVGTAAGIVLYAGLSGNVPAFTTVNVINNPNNFSVSLVYNANSLDVVVSASAATFLGTDPAAQGNWLGTYGNDGYNVIGDAASYPGYAQVSPAGQSDLVWAASTDDGRAVQKAGDPTDRIAAAWAAAGSLTVDVNLTDGQAHQLALYLLDFDSAGRSEQIDVFDAATGSVLDSQTGSGFDNGEYLVWNLTGHVQIRITALAGPDAVVSGLFFG